MQAATSYLETVLVYVKGKPFSVTLKGLLGLVAGASAITVLHSGLVWTVLFAALFTFFGAATFLLIADDQNGGIAGEYKKLLISLQSSWLEKFFEPISQSSNQPTRTASLRDVELANVPSSSILTSSRLERIYPWLNLTVPKVLDESLTNFLEIIINDYMTKDWYALVQVRKNFVNESRVSLRYCVSRLARRLMAVDFTTFIHEKVCRAAVEHVSVFLTLRKLSLASGENDLEVLLKGHPELNHYAMKESSGDSQEDLFFYRISTKILSHLLPRELRRFQASAAVLREVLTEMVLKIVVDAFSEPHRVNYLFDLAFCPPEQSEPAAVDLSQVPILRNLVNEEKPTSTIQKLPFRQIQKETILKNSFEQHLKSLGLEEFCKIHESISWINKFLDSPFLGEAATLSTYNSLLKLLKDIQAAEEKAHFFPTDFLTDIKAVAAVGPSAIPKLRQLPSWTSMNDQLLSLFDNLLVPSFQETRLYHHLLIPPTEETNRKRQLQRGTSRPRPPNPEALRMLGETVRGVLKDVPPVVDRQDSEIYEDYDGSIGLPDDDFEDLENGVPEISEDALGSMLRDLSFYDVSVLRAERRRDDRGRIFMILNITVFDRGPLSPDINKRWAVQRKYSEFYILDSKIRQFHGPLEASTYLPAKKAWSQPSLDFLQQRVGDFERFLQLLVHEPKLRYSQMLYNFLATTMEFDSSGFPDLGLGKVIRNVPQILTQERGQNIESFIRSLLNIALPAKGKAVNDSPVPKEATQAEIPTPPNHILDSIPFDPPAMNEGGSGGGSGSGKKMENIFDELLYLATALLKTDPEMLGLVACFHSFAVPFVEDFFHKKIEEFVEFFKNPQKLAFFLDLLSTALTSTHPPVDQAYVEQQRRATLDKFLLVAGTQWAEILCGGNAENVARLFSDLCQYKVLNKRLVLVLLDLIVGELFPELERADGPAVTPL